MNFGPLISLLLRAGKPFRVLSPCGSLVVLRVDLIAVVEMRLIVRCRMRSG